MSSSYIGSQFQLPVYSSRDPASTVTTRPSSTALLCIDSEDRYKDYLVSRANLTTPYSFSIQKNESIMNGFFTRIGVTEVVFPWVIPNINPKTNRIFLRYQLGAGPIAVALITLVPGFYIPSALASAIQVAVRAVAPAAGDLGSFTMTYGADNFPIFQYNSNQVGTKVAFDPLPYNNFVVAPGFYPFPEVTKQLYDVLGFTTSQNSITPLPPGGIDFQGGLTYAQSTRYFDIVCTQLTANQPLKDTMTQAVARDVLCRIYVGDAIGVQSTVVASSATFSPPGCAPTTIYRNFSHPKQIAWSPDCPIAGFLQFDVYDDTGAPLSESDPFSFAANNCNWSLTLQISET